MTPSPQSLLTSRRMAAARARRADAARESAPARLPAFAEAGLLAVGIDLADVGAILEFAEAAGSEARWVAAGGRAIGWAGLREWVGEMRGLE